MRSVTNCVIGCLFAALLPTRAAAGTTPLIPPVDAAISRGFQAPNGPYGAGHRGVDYEVPAGRRVRAAAGGRVAFAGTVAGSRAVTIQHEGGIRSTYSVLSEILVDRGEEVQQGQWIGLTGLAHPGGLPGLHFGVKVDGVYVDPTTMLGPSDVSDALHLAPLAWRPVPQLERLLPLPRSAGDYRRPCSRPAAISSALPPPDNNIAVAVAGIASQTAGGLAADLYEYGPERLGYPPSKVYRFSYLGVHGPHLHKPYRRADTYGELRIAVHRLRRLMVALGRRYPGVDVDLFGHSQGGIVARLYLESQASWDPRLPRVAHFVALATPNRGAPLAGLAAQMADSKGGRPLVKAVSRWSRSGASIPDPLTPAVAELAPDSSLLAAAARQDVAYGTQVLTLTSPFDVVVPSDRAAIPEKLNRIVPPNGLDAHRAIVRSEPARRIEYSFLRDGPVACRSWWDDHGRSVGAGIDWIEGHLGGVARAFTGPIRWGRTIAGRL